MADCSIQMVLKRGESGVVDMVLLTYYSRVAPELHEDILRQSSCGSDADAIDRCACVIVCIKHAILTAKLMTRRACGR